MEEFKNAFTSTDEDDFDRVLKYCEKSGIFDVVAKNTFLNCAILKKCNKVIESKNPVAGLDYSCLENLKSIGLNIEDDDAIVVINYDLVKIGEMSIGDYLEMANVQNQIKEIKSQVNDEHLSALMASDEGLNDLDIKSITTSKFVLILISNYVSINPGAINQVPDDCFYCYPMFSAEIMFNFMSKNLQVMAMADTHTRRRMETYVLDRLSTLEEYLNEKATCTYDSHRKVNYSKLFSEQNEVSAYLKSKVGGFAPEYRNENMAKMLITFATDYISKNLNLINEIPYELAIKDQSIYFNILYPKFYDILKFYANVSDENKYIAFEDIATKIMDYEDALYGRFEEIDRENIEEAQETDDPVEKVDEESELKYVKNFTSNNSNDFDDENSDDFNSESGLVS